jgi:3-hydroxybutyryl-CoA dehydrogenase
MITNIAIIGAGQMGSGIAHLFALHRYNVQLIDVSKDQLQHAEQTIEKNLNRQVAKGTISEQQKSEALKNMQLTTSIHQPEQVHLAIEAIVENLDIKLSLFQELDKLLQDDAILASNTSSISITQLAAMTNRSDRVIGIHFMNPPPIMPLVEVIPGKHTSDQTLKKSIDLIATLGKTPVVSKDAPGFIVNRILMPMINEAIFALQDGIASKEDIDIAMKLGTNQPMGPLELADFIGLDTCLSIMEVLHRGFGDNKYRPCPLLIDYVQSGQLGRKTNRGFYDY